MSEQERPPLTLRQALDEALWGLGYADSNRCITSDNCRCGEAMQVIEAFMVTLPEDAATPVSEGES